MANDAGTVIIGSRPLVECILALFIYFPGEERSGTRRVERLTRRGHRLLDVGHVRAASHTPDAGVHERD